eukprot:9337-Heterococcus_DN1.PRE.2
MLPYRDVHNERLSSHYIALNVRARELECVCTALCALFLDTASTKYRDGSSEMLTIMKEVLHAAYKQTISACHFDIAINMYTNAAAAALSVIFYDNQIQSLYTHDATVIPKSKRKEPCIAHALAVRESVATNNYHAFFRLYRRAYNYDVMHTQRRHSAALDSHRNCAKPGRQSNAGTTACVATTDATSVLHTVTMRLLPLAATASIAHSTASKL